jgi:hypothetical protein
MATSTLRLRGKYALGTVTPIPASIVAPLYPHSASGRRRMSYSDIELLGKHVLLQL